MITILAVCGPVTEKLDATLLQPHWSERALSQAQRNELIVNSEKTRKPCTCHGFTKVSSNTRTSKGTKSLGTYGKTTCQRLSQILNRHVHLKVCTGQDGEPGVLYEAILTFLFPYQLGLKHFLRKMQTEISNLFFIYTQYSPKRK